MNGIEKALTMLKSNAASRDEVALPAIAQLPVSLAFIVAVISVPLLDAGRLVWFFCYPIVMSEALHVGYGRVFLRSLWALPFVVAIGIFNPLLDTAPCWTVGGVTVSSGWVSLLSIVLRGLLTVQALILLISSCGFRQVCGALSRMGVPKVLVSQLMLLYRFLGVLLDETLTMHRARQSRGFGRKSYPLSMWGTFAGQLFVRSFDRAMRINRSMIARGFTGDMVLSPADTAKMSVSSWVYMLVWAAIFAALRFVDLSAIAERFITNSI